MCNEEGAPHLATDFFPASLLMVHDSAAGSQHDHSKLRAAPHPSPRSTSSPDCWGGTQYNAPPTMTNKEQTMIKNENETNTKTRSNASE